MTGRETLGGVGAHQGEVNGTDENTTVETTPATEKMTAGENGTGGTTEDGTTGGTAVVTATAEENLLHEKGRAIQMATVHETAL